MLFRLLRWMEFSFANIQIPHVSCSRIHGRSEWRLDTQHTHDNSEFTFSVQLKTNKQTNKQTNQYLGQIVVCNSCVTFIEKNLKRFTISRRLTQEIKPHEAENYSHITLIGQWLSGHMCQLQFHYSLLFICCCCCCLPNQMHQILDTAEDRDKLHKVLKEFHRLVTGAQGGWSFTGLWLGHRVGGVSQKKKSLPLCINRMK